MKLIHCADLHLDSNLTTHFSREQARARKNELLLTFQRMANYATEHQVKAVLIAGDLFDKKTISAGARRFVMDVICGHPEVDFYYLVGNHDASSFLEHMETRPKNLMLFGENWITYVLGETEQGRITLSGADFSADKAGQKGTVPVLAPEDFNIVMLHGQVAGYSQKKGEIIDLRQYENRSIDYLALGHIHSYQEGALPPRGIFCYPGCLEGRGFDECGEHGFVLLEIDEKKNVTRQFVPFASRKLLLCQVPVTGCPASAQVIEAIEAELEGQAGPGDMVKVVLTGEVDMEQEIDGELICQHFQGQYAVFRLEDESTRVVDYTLYEKDASLKGEFVRAVEAAEGLDREEKAEIIRCGLRALEGEEVFA